MACTTHPRLRKAGQNQIRWFSGNNVAAPRPFANFMAHLDTQFSSRVRKCAHHSTADDLNRRFSAEEEVAKIGLAFGFSFQLGLGA